MDALVAAPASAAPTCVDAQGNGTACADATADPATGASVDASFTGAGATAGNSASVHFGVGL